MVYYELDTLYLGFRKLHEKITFLVNSKIHILYRVLSGQERTMIRIMSLELKLDRYFFKFLSTIEILKVSALIEEIKKIW